MIPKGFEKEKEGAKSGDVHHRHATAILTSILSKDYSLITCLFFSVSCKLDTLLRQLIWTVQSKAALLLLH